MDKGSIDILKPSSIALKDSASQISFFHTNANFSRTKQTFQEQDNGPKMAIKKQVFGFTFTGSLLLHNFCVKSFEFIGKTLGLLDWDQSLSEEETEQSWKCWKSWSFLTSCWALRTDELCQKMKKIASMKCRRFFTVQMWLVGSKAPFWRSAENATSNCQAASQRLTLTANAET